MFDALSPRASRLQRAATVALALLAAAATATPAAAGDRDWPSRITASYKVAFNGFDIGRFSFDAEIRSGRYTLTSSAQLSALLGAFKWQGETRVSGSLAKTVAEPREYAFDFQSNAKSGAVKMSFREGDVTVIAASPPVPPSEDVVPLERRHLSDVLDPLSAVIALSRPANGAPCSQRLPIFDGKQRFDLVLSPRGERPISEKRPSGLPSLVHVCDMRYVPIAGYKRGSQAEELQQTMTIEVALRPVPGANLFVPHQITIPVPVGTAVLTIDRIDILTSNSDQIAFAN